MKRSAPSKSGMAIAEEAFALLRGAPIDGLATYYIGSLPFVLGVITFWATMAQSAYAHQQLAGGALGLGLLFIWMKLWHVRFARRLRAHLAEVPPEPWSFMRSLRTAGLQGALHSTGLLLLPLALLITVPFPWVYATYQNAVALDDGTFRSVGDLTRAAARESRRWPKQNMLLIWLLSPFLLILATVVYLALVPVVFAILPAWSMPIVIFYAALMGLALLLLSPFGVIIALNMASGIMLIVYLLQIFTGLDTVFSQAPAAASNTTFTAIIVGLTWLCVDPLMKAAYVIRCFYGESLETGEDLRLALRRLRRQAAPVLAVSALLLGFAGTAQAQDPAPPPAVSPAQLEQSIESTLQQSEYAWRMPREAVEIASDNAIVSGIRSAVEWVGDSLKWVAKKIADFIQGLIPDGDIGGAAEGFSTEPIRFVVMALTVLLVLLLAVLLYRIWRQRQRLRRPETAAAAQPALDLEREDTAADALPQEGWLQMARELMQQGDWRLAMRALFLATLAGLADRKLIQVARFKANYEYKRELSRRGHAHPQLLPAFNAAVSLYEAVWYGEHPADETAARDLLRRYEEVVEHA